MYEVNPKKVDKELACNITVAYRTVIHKHPVFIYRWNTGYWSWKLEKSKANVGEFFLLDRDDAVESAKEVLSWK